MRALGTFNKWSCFLSTILLCSGVLTHDVWCTIPLLTKKLVMKNLVSLSLLVIFIVVSNCLNKNNKIFQSLDSLRFFFKGKIYVYLE